MKSLINKLKRTGSVVDEQRPGIPFITLDTVQRVEYAITRSPSASTRTLTRKLGNVHIAFKLYVNLKNTTLQPGKLCVMTS